MDSSVVETLETAETIGQAQYDAFVQERLVLYEKPVKQTLYLNKPLPVRDSTTEGPKQKSASGGLTEDELKTNSLDCIFLASHAAEILQSYSPLKTRPANINLKHGNTAQSQILCDAYSQQHQTK